jgi:hypothetical protein
MRPIGTLTHFEMFQRMFYLLLLLTNASIIAYAPEQMNHSHVHLIEVADGEAKLALMFRRKLGCGESWDVEDKTS